MMSLHLVRPSDAPHHIITAWTRTMRGQGLSERTITERTRVIRQLAIATGSSTTPTATTTPPYVSHGPNPRTPAHRLAAVRGARRVRWVAGGGAGRLGRWGTAGDTVRGRAGWPPNTPSENEDGRAGPRPRRGATQAPSPAPSHAHWEE
mgnify:FL=1